MQLDRRTALTLAASALAASDHAVQAEEEKDASQPFQFRYALASCMFGYTPLAEIMPEAKKMGATGIDIWPKVHGLSLIHI